MTIDQIVEDATKVFERVVCKGAYAHLIRSGGGCVYWAASAIIAQQVRGDGSSLEFVPVAGSLHWPITDDPDLLKRDYFSYQWDSSHPLNRVMLAQGSLPEMHVWMHSRKGRMLDLSTVGLRDSFYTTKRNAAGGMPEDMDWKAAPPPRYVYGDPADVAAAWQAAYIPCIEASRIALGAVKFAVDTHREEGFRLLA